MPLPSSRSNPSAVRRRQLDSGGDNDGVRRQLLFIVEHDAAGVRIDADDFAGDEDLCSEPLGLPVRTARELGAGNPAWKAEVVLDPRRCLRLAARRFLFNDDRAQTLRGAIHGGGETRRAAADDHRIVGCEPRRRLKAEARGKLSRLRAYQRCAIGESQHRAIARRRWLPGPVVGKTGIVRRHPVERDLVALEKPSEIEAGAVPTVPEQYDLSIARLRRKLLQPPDALAGEFVHCPRKFGRRGGDGVVGPCVQFQDPRRLAGPEAGLKLRAEDERDFAEQFAARPRAKFALDPVDEFDDFDRSFEHDEEGWRFALIDRVLSSIEMNVRGRARDIGQHDRRKGRKERNRRDFVRCQHDLPEEQSGSRPAACGSGSAELSARG